MGMPRNSILLIESDESIAVLVSTVLRRAGFVTRVVPDADAAAPLLREMRFDVIVRDLVLTPSNREQALAELTATAPELLRRTVIATTARDSALAAIPPQSVFAVVPKPFDLRQLVDVVTACAAASPEAARRELPVDLESLERFVRTAPRLRDLLKLAPASEHELVLRAEMRRTVMALSATLDVAAEHEPSGSRAAVMRAVSAMAANVADTAHARARVRHDH